MREFQPAAVITGLGALAVVGVGLTVLVVTTNPPVDHTAESRVVTAARAHQSTTTAAPPTTPTIPTTTTTTYGQSPTALVAGAGQLTYADPQQRFHVTHPSTWTTTPLGAGNGVHFTVGLPDGGTSVFEIVLRVDADPNHKRILISGSVNNRSAGDATFPVTVAGRPATAVEHDTKATATGKATVQCFVYVDIGPGVATLTYTVSGPSSTTGRQQFVDALTTFAVP